MRQLGNLPAEEFLDVVADIVEPASKLLTPEIKALFKQKAYPKAISLLIKNNKKEVFEILAIIDKKDVKDIKAYSGGKLLNEITSLIMDEGFTDFLESLRAFKKKE